jgi:hypothetical protein
MLRQSRKDGFGAIAGMNGDIRIEQVSQSAPGPLIAPAQGYFDRLPFFDPQWFWHAPQGSNRVFQAVAGWKDCDYVAKPGDFQIDVGIGISQLCRNANGLAITGFEHARPRHLSCFRDILKVFAPQMYRGARTNVNPCIYRAAGQPCAATL